jgi:hypothetical protein
MRCETTTTSYENVFVCLCVDEPYVLLVEHDFRAKNRDEIIKFKQAARAMFIL